MSELNSDLLGDNGAFMVSFDGPHDDENEEPQPYPRFHVRYERPLKRIWHPILELWEKAKRQKKPEKSTLAKWAKYACPSLLLFIILIIVARQHSSVKEHSATLDQLTTELGLIEVATQDIQIDTSPTPQREVAEDFSNFYSRTGKERSIGLLTARQNYEQNRQLWQKWNSEAKGLVEFGETPFADEALANLSKLINSRNVAAHTEIDECANRVMSSRIPRNVDLRNHLTHIPRIKNQGYNCNSGYTYVVTDSLLLDGLFNATSKFDNPQVASAQLLLCDGFNNGCHGGSLADSMVTLGTSNMSMVYEMEESASAAACTGNWITVNNISFVFPIRDHNKPVLKRYKRAKPCALFNPEIARKNELPYTYSFIASTLASNKSVLAEITIDQNFFFYKSGVYNVSSEPIGTQAVLLIGYGEDASGRFLIGRNSWGTDWGEQGYFRIRETSIVAAELYSWVSLRRGGPPRPISSGYGYYRRTSDEEYD